jgi:hypothetical protein
LGILLDVGVEVVAEFESSTPEIEDALVEIFELLEDELDFDLSALDEEELDLEDIWNQEIDEI